MLHKQILVPLAAAAAALFATQAGAVDFHGYMRSGAGWGSKDGGQTCVNLPGDRGNFLRLGNECGTYGEAQFDQNVYDGKDGVKFDYHIMLGYFAPSQQDFENLADPGNHIALRQNWVEAKNLPFLNGGSAWVGKRYYQRHDVHITDFFYWNNSGPGAGVEKFKLGGGMTGSFAILRHNGFANGNANNDATTSFDFRVHDINLGGAGSLEVGLALDTADTKLANKKSSTILSGEWSLPVLGGVNKLFLTTSTGGGNSLGDFNNVPGNKDGTWGIQDMIQWQISPELSGMAVAGHFDFKNNYKWDYIGARPVYHVSDYFKVQGEVGYEATTPAGGQKLKLGKVTIAPTLVAGRGFWARPELRAYYSYAKWNSAAQAANVAGGVTGPFGTSKNGSSYGLQVEAWW
jgi:maltoporin